MKVDVLLGLQWGDEGKGKVVDVLTPRYDVVARKRRSYSGIRRTEICSPFYSVRYFPGRQSKYYR